MLWAAVAGIALGPVDGLAAAASEAAPLFEDVSELAGIEFLNVSGEREKTNITGSLGSGAALFDYDQDGDLDAYLVNGAATSGLEIRERHPNRLFQNLGAWRFRDVTDEAGVGDLGWGMGAAVGDFDNDGFPDIYVTNLGANLLYRNQGDGTFREVTDAAAVGDVSWGASAAWLDADADGDLDLFVANYLDPSIRKVPSASTSMMHAPGVMGDIYCRFQNVPVYCGPLGLVGATDVFYLNDGDGSFTKVSEGWDVEAAFGLGVVTLDFDGDGRMDLYVANDATPNQLYRNLGGGRFEEVGLTAGVAYNGVGRAEAGMGVDAADVDGDGWLDLFVTNFSHETNTIYVNTGGSGFVDRTEELFPGRPSFAYLGWAARFLDLDFDGDEDLFVANGHVFPQIDGEDVGTSYRQPNQVFRNEGGRFVETPLPPEDASRRQASSRGVAFGDVDDDGHPDALVVQIDDRATLMRNTGAWASGRSWVGFRLVGRAVNRDAHGARLRLETAGGALVAFREVHASGFLSSSDPRLHFGLGEKASVERAVVRWPDGTEQVLEGLQANRYHTIIQDVARRRPARTKAHNLTGGSQ